MHLQDYQRSWKILNFNPSFVAENILNWVQNSSDRNPMRGQKSIRISESREQIKDNILEIKQLSKPNNNSNLLNSTESNSRQLGLT